MNTNIYRHKILKHLSKKLLTGGSRDINDDLVYFSYSEIRDILNYKKNDLRLIITELIENKEISYHFGAKGKGLICNNLGLISYSNKKYLKIYRTEIITLIKDCVQIFIPVMSLLIAYIALTIKFGDIDKTTKERIESMQHKIDTLDIKVKNSIFQKKKFETDSLFLE